LQDTFIHPQALIEKGVEIKEGTRVWAFAHILGDVSIGRDCNICDHTFIESGVEIGDRVTVKCGVFLWTGIVLEDDVFVGPCATFTNDLRPRSRRRPDSFLTTRVSRGASIGANATLLPGIEVGRFAMVGAGSVVVRDVPAHALVVGNPARRVGWICKCGEALNFVDGKASCCGYSYRLSNDLVGISDGD